MTEEISLFDMINFFKRKIKSIAVITFVSFIVFATVIFTTGIANSKYSYNQQIQLAYYNKTDNTRITKTSITDANNLLGYSLPHYYTLHNLNRIFASDLSTKTQGLLDAAGKPITSINPDPSIIQLAYKINKPTDFKHIKIQTYFDNSLKLIQEIEANKIKLLKRQLNTDITVNTNEMNQLNSSNKNLKQLINSSPVLKASKANYTNGGTNSNLFYLAKASMIGNLGSYSVKFNQMLYSLKYKILSYKNELQSIQPSSFLGQPYITKTKSKLLIFLVGAALLSFLLAIFSAVIAQLSKKNNSS